MELKRYLILSDVHLPFHNEEAYRLVLAYAKELKPDQIIILGDFADFYNISSYGKSPLVSEKFSEEVDVVVRELRVLKEICEDIVFIEGNHCNRLIRFIGQNCKELGDFVSVEKLFFLGAMGIKFIPFEPSQLYKIPECEVYLRHRPLNGGIHCAYGTLMKAQKTVIFGDAHRMQRYFTTSIDGTEIEGISVGWMGDKKSEVFKFTPHHIVWTMGFAVLTTRGNQYYVDQIHVKDKDGKFSFIADGNLWTT